MAKDKPTPSVAECQAQSSASVAAQYRSRTTSTSQVHAALVKSTTRMAGVISAAVLPRLRRSDISDSLTIQKSPLLSLTLTSPSFLDSTLTEDGIHHPLYTVKTVGTTTDISRSDPWGGTNKAAEIKWPKSIPTSTKRKTLESVLVQINSGRWSNGDKVLKPCSVLSARKFHIPNCSHSLKWKCIGSIYNCTTASVKGPIATFEPAIGLSPAKLTVYETLRDKYDGRPIHVHKDVSIILLDHLVVTALLLVTDVQEWMLLPKYQARDRSLDIAPSLMSLAPSNFMSSEFGHGHSDLSHSTSAIQLRKVIYGEPLYPQLSSRAHSPSPSDFTDVDVKSQLLRPESATISMTYSEDEDEERDRFFVSRGAFSPSEPHYPVLGTVAPTHTCMDPSFYQGNTVHSVPPLPQQHQAIASGSKSPSASVFVSGFHRPRKLPTPPRDLVSPSPPPFRSQSAPPRSSDEQARGSSETMATTPAPASLSRTPLHVPPRQVLRMNSASALSNVRSLPTSPMRTDPFIPPNKRVSGFGPRPLPLKPKILKQSSSQIFGQRMADRSRAPHPLAKEAEGLAQWMGSLTTHRETVTATQEVFDLPPPAYNSITFLPSSHREAR